MKEKTHRLQHYLPLLGILTSSLVGFLIFSYDKNFQAAVVIAGSLGYASWGLIHHFIHKDLYFSVVLEYFTIAFLGIVIVLSLLFRV